MIVIIIIARGSIKQNKAKHSVSNNIIPQLITDNGTNKLHPNLNCALNCLLALRRFYYTSSTETRNHFLISKINTDIWKCHTEIKYSTDNVKDIGIASIIHAHLKSERPMEERRDKIGSVRWAYSLKLLTKTRHAAPIRTLDFSIALGGTGVEFSD